MSDCQMADTLREAIRAVLFDALEVYPGDEALRLINKILDIINDKGGDDDQQ